MMNLEQEACSYHNFSDLLTGYRLSSALMMAHDAGVFDAIDQNGAEGSELCQRLGWDLAYGDRFLRCLCGLGLLRQHDDRYFLSPFAATYLCSLSGQYQGKTLAFEKQLYHSWEQLATTLETGKRVFATKDKDPQELEQAFSTYLGSMDEAARIRAKELWDWFPLPASSGTILDIGSGSGAFLYDFLIRHTAWRGVFCDLPEVVAIKELHQRVAEMEHRVSWCSCNLLADSTSGFDSISERSCDIVLLSNIIHCQGTPETDTLLRKAASRTREKGVIVIHDFFSDTGWRGSLYDIHMMLNTFNGKTYSLQEIIEMAAPYGFCHNFTKQLCSGSTAHILARNRGGDRL
jgi:cyclopropane fatty-acyl-phospholipid synthase-like methyltransferase